MRQGTTSGFTLVEVCIVLFIVAVLFAVAAMPVSRLLHQEHLEKPIRTLQSFAKTARQLAMAEHRTYVVVLSGFRYALQPLTDEDKNNEQEVYELPPDITFTIQYPNESEFHRPSDARWLFSPNGLCEPVRFLFQRGNNWIKFRINPLTARIEDRQSYIQ
jgi:prepilin-type N-terminal cleavage/methylation domain-containing protein